MKLKTTYLIFLILSFAGAAKAAPHHVIFETNPDSADVISAFKARINASTRYEVVEKESDEPDIFVYVDCLAIKEYHGVYTCYYIADYLSPDIISLGGAMSLFTVDLCRQIAMGTPSYIAEAFFHNFVDWTTDVKIEKREAKLRESVVNVRKIAVQEWELAKKQAKSASQTNTVPFIIASGDSGPPLLLVRAKINGHPVTLLFDSGTQGVSVDKHVFDGVRAEGKTLKEGLGGRVTEDVFRTTIEFGSDIFTDALVSTMSTADTSALSRDENIRIDGLLGQHIMAQYSRVTIDYKAKKLVFEH